MTKITTIIFDLGGVILNLDQTLTLRSFGNLGFNAELMEAEAPLFHAFEKGEISADEFRTSLKQHLKEEITQIQIDEAWNAMLLDLPQDRLEILRTLRKSYTIFLLSNTNSIHIDAFDAYISAHHPDLNWLELFDKVYYSYKIGLRKPDRDIYEYVLKENNLSAGECIFIDDMKPNLEGAAEAGLHTIHAHKPLDQDLLNGIESLIRKNP